MTRGSVSARIQELKTKVMELSPETMLTEGAEMSRLTTLRLGGPADLLAEPCNVDGLQTLLRESSRLELPVTLIGRGSDLLVRDGGIRGRSAQCHVPAGPSARHAPCRFRAMWSA